MKLDKPNGSLNRTGAGRAFSKACRACYGAILAEIRSAREKILAEARETLKVQERLLRLAVNEAEALAWETLYPQLVFPNLAREKIQGAAEWTLRQRLVAELPGHRR